MSTGPSLYRRHRPRTFADVVGQEHVVRTLRNAVQQGKVHHAYLFVGSRGTGKTSMAKILAACLNCENGPTIEPCGVCPSCVAIASATSLDVIEMDAASNNSVDDIRELRDKVGFAPVSGRSKVYILDEAHMLSTAAWNAFLKTLEEPPPDTIFVLATTEADKVLATVVDRCHRFDFGRPTTEQLAGVVGRVATQEGIAIPPEAVALLARHATGSFRDALGTLEQLVTYSGETITMDDALAVLGVANDDMLFGVVDAIAAGDARSTLLSVHDLAQSGRDLGLFARHLESHARELMVSQTLGEVPAEIAVTPDRDARLADQAERVAPGDVVRLLDLLAVMLRTTKDGADARTQLELALVKAANPETDATTRALLARLERLENGSAAPSARTVTVPERAAPIEIPAAVAPPTLAPSAPPATTAEPPTAVAPAVETSPPVEAVPSPPVASPPVEAVPSPPDASPPVVAVPPASVASPPVEVAPPAPVVAPPVVPAPPASVASPPVEVAPPGPVASPPVDAVPPAPVASPPVPVDVPDDGSAPWPTEAYGEPSEWDEPSAPASAPPAPVTAVAPAPPAVAPVPPAAAPPAPPARPAEPAPEPAAATATVVAVPDPVAVAAPAPGPLGAVDLDALRALWPAIVETVGTEHSLLGAVLADARCTALEDGELVVGFPASAPFNKRRADDSANREIVLEALRTLSGRPLRLRYDTYDDADTPAAAELTGADPVSEEEMVARFLTAFDAEEIIPGEEPDA